jgi:hypothetical protein
MVPLAVGREGGVALNQQARYSHAMSTVQEIEKAVSQLPDEELAAFREWFADFDASSWDRQFEADVSAGRLDQLAEEALQDLREGRCTDL